MFQLHLRPDELAYLTYIARRIDGEVSCMRKGAQGPLLTAHRVRRLAGLAEEILGEDELQGWLEAATSAGGRLAL